MKVLGLLFLCVGACFAATTVEVLAGDSQFSQLVSLVSQAGLVDALNQGTFTIFAPTNAAFSKISAADLANLANDKAQLTKVLTYHVVNGKIPSTSVRNEELEKTLSGDSIRFNIYSHNNVVTVQGSTITTFDKQADNGVIHVIDTVMMPPPGNIVEIVQSTSDVSTLLKFVLQAGIAANLTGDGLTVFAPTNAAFAKLPQRMVSTLNGNPGLLAEILEYHVVPHTEYSQGLYNRESLRTLDRRHDRILIHATSTGIRVNTNGNVIKADIGASNGVIHLIDHVLVPARYYLSLLIGK